MSVTLPASIPEGVAWACAPAREMAWSEMDRGREQSPLARHTPFVPRDARLRRDLASSMPGVRGVFVVAVPFGDGSFEPGRFQLSQSTWGPDYHRILPPIIRGIVAGVMGSEVARSAHVQVDSGPLEERALALSVGLGYPGYNASVLVPGVGPRAFLGLALTHRAPPRVRLVEDSADFHPRCAHCYSCIKACPTGALVAPGVVNPLRCLSYLTQKRGILPAALARKMGGRLYGCDECLRACHVGRTAAPGGPFSGRRDDRAPDPREILSADHAGFRGRWAGKAAFWRGRRVLERNALNALGCAGDTNASRVLEDFSLHASPVLRATALRSLGFMAQRGLWHNIGPIRRAADDDADRVVRAVARGVLSEM